MRPTAWLATAAIAGAVLAGCNESTTGNDDTVSLRYGAPVSVGNGSARAYVSMAADGVPVEIGIALGDAALEGLPAAGANPGGMPNSYLLPLPAGMPAPYQVVELDWNPAGHPPVGVYDAPHFDFHFYAISAAERGAILPSDPAFATKAANLPSGGFVPPGYMVLPPPPAPVEAIPMMGVHWLNVAAPELQPPTSPDHKAFSRTFIYGSWDGRFIFVEPMVTRAFLLTRPDETIPIPTPAAWAAPGWYPAAYRVAYDAEHHEYRIALTTLTDHS
jgi:hypothetical protein